MFKNKTNSSVGESSTATTIIGAGTTITGNLLCNGDIRIDGTLKGNLEAKAKVIVGAGGLVEGDINGKQADILGKVKGIIKVSELLYIHEKGNVDGDLFAAQLKIDPTASFNGKSHMGGNIVDINALPASTNVASVK
jgi:cytoskeletal protein CcmA (bactofilin family)